jgi:predicted metalloprotease
MPLPIPMGGKGAGGLVGILVVLAVLFFGSRVIGGDGGLGIDAIDQFPQASQGGGSTLQPSNDLEELVSFVADDTQQFWQEQFQAAGRNWEDATVAVFRSRVGTGCGAADASVGPFYCPNDQTVYFDLGFFRALADRFGAPGDFAQAYVITHEIGHHVQNLLDLGVGRPAAPGPDSAAVAIELQADCFAGIWGYAASRSGNFSVGRVELEPDDAEEALRAAAAIGDDRLQKMSTGRVMPERFTHGTSAQRVEWFRRGMESGDPRACDTRR